MGGLKRIHNYWRSKLEAVPIADQQAEIFDEMAGSKKLSDIGPLVLIDSLVTAYPAYTHDDIFDLSLVFIYQILEIRRRKDYISYQSTLMRRKSIKK